MSIKIARVNYFGDSEEKWHEIMKGIKKDLAGVKIYDSRYGFTDHWGFGNYCLYGVPYEKAVYLADKYGLKIDNEVTVIEKSDLEKIQVSDKVTLLIDGMFGISKVKGTVVNKDENSVTVRKYRSKTQGWIIKAGMTGDVVVGW